MILSSSALLYRKKILQEMANATNENDISQSIGQDILIYSDVAIYDEYDADTDVAAKPDDSVKLPEISQDDVNSSDNGNIDNTLDDTDREDIYVGQDKEFTFIALGEIMLGNEDATKYDFISSFRDVAKHTADADFTIASLSTNIVDKKKKKDVKNKYIVTSSVIKSFETLGVDAINVATDHMVDYSKTIFDSTIDILRKNNLNVMGLYNDVIYAENDGIKVAFIGVNNEVIGSYYKYTSYGILMYDDYMTNLKALIADTKQKADFVVIVTHLGLENKQTVTSVMSWFYKALINAGADMVLGNHALGSYPITMHNGKPIIYSLSYLVTDSKYEEAHKSGIYKFTLDVNGALKSIEIVPIYSTKDKRVVLYSEYNLNDSMNFLRRISEKKYDGVNMQIVENKLLVEFK